MYVVTQGISTLTLLVQNVSNKHVVFVMEYVTVTTMIFNGFFVIILY